MVFGRNSVIRSIIAVLIIVLMISTTSPDVIIGVKHRTEEPGKGKTVNYNGNIIANKHRSDKLSVIIVEYLKNS